MEAEFALSTVEIMLSERAAKFQIHLVMQEPTV